MSITPGRTTVVTIDSPIWSTVTQPTNGSFVMGQIASDGLVESGNIEFIEGVGYQLTAIQRLQSFKHETDAADKYAYRKQAGGTPDPDPLIALHEGSAPTGILSKPAYRANTDLTGISLGSRRNNGDNFLQKQVAQGASYDDKLTADEAAYPPPDASDDLVPCDRVFVSNVNHEPNDGLSLTIKMPASSGVSSLNTVARVYFTGIPGSTSPLPPNGIGQYCLVLRGDGKAFLKERTVETVTDPETEIGEEVFAWVKRRDFRWCDANQIAGGTHTIHVHQDALKLEGGEWTGSTINFQFATFGQGLIQDAITQIKLFGGQNWVPYKIPQTKKIAPQLAPVRFDLRRDVRASFQFHKHAFRDSGQFSTVKFKLSQPAIGTDPNPIVIRWFGSMPAGVVTDSTPFVASTITTTLYGQDGTACTPIDAGTTSLTAGERTFEPIAGEDTYYATFAYTPDGSKTRTPFINRMDYGQAGTRIKTDLDPAVLPQVTSVTLTGQDSDPGHESMGIICEDRYELVPQLAFRSGMPIKVEVQYDPGDPDLKSILAQGYVAEARGRRKTTYRTPGRQGTTEAKMWRCWTIKAQGEWAKLARAQAPCRIDLTKNTDSLGKATPYKITDVLKELFSNAGYAPHQYYVPDLPALFLNDGRTPQLIEPFSELYPLMVMLAREYLGAYITWEPNSSTSSDPDEMDGLWRVKLPPRPASSGDAFNYLAHFRTDQRMNVSGTFDTLTNGQIVKRVPVNKAGFHEWVEKPEANIVTVYGVGFAKTTGVLQKSAGVLLQIPPLPNWKSAEFGQSSEDPITKPLPDPNSPDYLGYQLPLFYSDPGINSEALARLIQYRLYDMTCHAKKKFVFEAPLVLVTDITDTYQRQPRKLMYGDPVMLNGATFFVDSCNADYHGRRGGDRIQMASYELFSVPALTDYSKVITGRTD